MTSERIDIVARSDTGQTVAALNQITQAINRMASQGSEQTGRLEGAVGRLATRYISLSSALGLAQRAMGMFLAVNREAMDQSREAAKTVDESFRRFAVQAGRAAPGARMAIGQAAQAAGLPFETGAEAATALLGRGVTQEQLFPGGGLQRFLEFFAAMRAAGQPAGAGQMAQQVGALAAGRGGAPTPAAMQQVMVALQNLAQRTPFQADQIAGLAKHAPTLARAGLTPAEQIGLYSAMVEQYGESMTSTILNRATFGMAVGGAQARHSVRALMGQFPEGARRAQIAADVEGYQRAVRIATTGPAAEYRRLDLESQSRALRGDALQTDIMGEVLEREVSRRSIFGRMGGRMYRRMYDVGTALGMSPRAAAGFVLDEHFQQPGQNNALSRILSDVANRLSRAMDQGVTVKLSEPNQPERRGTLKINDAGKPIRKGR